MVTKEGILTSTQSTKKFFKGFEYKFMQGIKFLSLLSVKAPLNSLHGINVFLVN